jgi:hypothetical protein
MEYRSEPPIGREADPVKDVFEAVRHHRAECRGRTEFHWGRVYRQAMKGRVDQQMCGRGISELTCTPPCHQ